MTEGDFRVHRQTRRAVWKFVIGIGVTTIKVSQFGAVVLTGLDPATGDLAIWIENDPDAIQVERRFTVYGTGHEIAGDGGFPYDLHVGSVIDGEFVWHVYERRTA